MMTVPRFVALLSLCSGLASGFAPPVSNEATAPTTTTFLGSTSSPETADSETTKASVDPKEAVKIFGRLADKYILLDSSGGMCCYSACTDCEYRLPDGGYRMADQSASRPKWICAYDDRNFESSGKEHTSKWSLDVYGDDKLAVTKDEFVQALVDTPYKPPLGGPYVGASAATIEDTTAAAAFFDLLAGEKEKLTKHRFGTRIKELAGGEEGLTWAGFSDAMTS